MDKPDNISKRPNKLQKRVVMLGIVVAMIIAVPVIMNTIEEYRVKTHRARVEACEIYPETVIEFDPETGKQKGPAITRWKTREELGISVDAYMKCRRLKAKQ